MPLVTDVSRLAVSYTKLHALSSSKLLRSHLSVAEGISVTSIRLPIHVDKRAGRIIGIGDDASGGHDTALDGAAACPAQRNEKRSLRGWVALNFIGYACVAYGTRPAARPELTPARPCATMSLHSTERRRIPCEEHAISFCLVRLPSCSQSQAFLLLLIRAVGALRSRLVDS